MNNLDLKDKKIAILGLGIEGIAVAKFLGERKANLTFLDELPSSNILERVDGGERSDLSRLFEKYNFISGEEHLDNLSSFDLIFRSPGISINHPKLREAKKNGVTISSQIKLFFDLCPATIIGVSGTKGKGTTSSLIFEILKKHFENSNKDVYIAGNIGYPAISLIPKLKNDDFVILELSSFQLMDLDKSPHIAVITNLTEDHLNYHKDRFEYALSKLNLLKYQGDADFAVLNLDSTFDQNVLEKEVRSKKKYFSSTKEADAIVKDNKVILDPDNRSIMICDINSINLFGRHNLENIAAASIVADIVGVASEVVREVASEFKGLPHRLEFVAEVGGVKFINDSFATNPEPTIAAINSFSTNKILILGGSSKGANFDNLSKHIATSKVGGVVIMGAEGEKIKASLLRQGYEGKVIESSGTIDKIVANAMNLSKPNDVVILSPACASFDMFKNYKDRGEKFRNAVLKLQNHKLRVKV